MKKTAAIAALVVALAVSRCSDVAAEDVERPYGAFLDAAGAGDEAALIANGLAICEALDNGQGFAEVEAQYGAQVFSAALLNLCNFS